MTTMQALKAFCLLIPVAGLLLMGLWVSMGSGVARLATADGVRKAWANLSHTLLFVAGSMLALFAVQFLVGYRLDLGL